MTMTRQQWEEQWIGIAQNTYDSNSEELLNQLDELYEKCEEKIVDWLNDLLLRALDQGISRTDLWDWQRYKSFEKRLGWEIANLGGKEISALAEMMERSIKETYGKTEVPGATITGDFTLMNDTAVKQLVNTRWSNKLYSSAIWDNKSAMLNELRKGLRDTLVLGESKDKLVDHINKTFKKGFANSDRLVRTELMNVINQGQRKKYKDSGVEQLEVIVVEDSRICSACEGRSGEYIDVNSSDIPPFHPRCRCCVVAVVDWSKLQQDGLVEEAETTAERTQVTYSDADLRQKLEKATSDKLKNVMGAEDYKAYMDLLSKSPDVANLYIKYIGQLKDIQLTKNDGEYSARTNTLKYSYREHIYKDLNRFETLAHEVGHFFDYHGKYKATFKELDMLKDRIKGWEMIFPRCTSGSDEFLAAVRKDKTLLQELMTSDKWQSIVEDMRANNTSSGVGDAIDGMFNIRPTGWGHGGSYYNTEANMVNTFKAWKEVREMYRELGFEAKTKMDTLKITRDYRTAKEIWANITSAVVTQDDALEYVKEYLPNCYEAYLELIRSAE